MSLAIGTFFPGFGDTLKWLNNSTSFGRNQRISLFHFWSISCPACHANMPALHELRDKYGPLGLQVVAVHRPRSDNELDADNVRKVADELGMTEPCALDNDHKIGDELGVEAWPTYFLFGADGRLRRHAKGNFGVRMMGVALEKMFGECA